MPWALHLQVPARAFVLYENFNPLPPEEDFVIKNQEQGLQAHFKLWTLH